MDDYQPPRFTLPKRSKEELYRQALLYRRLAAAISNKERAMQLEEAARECERLAASLRLDANNPSTDD